MKASIFLMGIPLAYSFFLYAVMGQLAKLGATFLISIVIAGLVVGILAAVNILGSGLNAMGTFIAFTIALSASFYGLAVAGYNVGIGGLMTNAQSVGDFPYKSYFDIIFACMYGLGVYFLVTDRGGD